MRLTFTFFKSYGLSMAKFSRVSQQSIVSLKINQIQTITTELLHTLEASKTINNV